ncbi:IclR family transcriptional regulator [Brevibacterium sp. 50QC2O2]|uniref:IclR family transcriptional regulator n=1 Tax=Brevibacterium TaxID=1696 RepID=UPI00211BC26B|nr:MULTISPECIES: IclR family transcriptional regulator [unclassified Brevibacterium]MCQ9367705.1 IclR family transcriptional regulator [Brevibacterium sp. 91QC2O2]MCQ9384989.1 IclR family transcriptional regulator [Brevibacterium sp. 68QC2CO]MCQ9387964.1 IclR family transcriptional regulator [Brevibacterium sp. 50QC2O2]
MVQHVQSVDRTLDVLEALVAAGGTAREKDLAAACELPAPTVHRILATLTARGYVLQFADRSYALGSRLVRLGAVAARQVGASVQPILTALAKDLGETVNLAFLTRDSMTYVAQAASPRSMRMFTEVGRSVPLHNSGVGKAVLASLPDSVAEPLLDASVGGPRARRHINLEAELAQCRNRGFALDDEEQEVGVRCLAVAVAGAPSPAGLSVSGPTSRLGPDVYPAVAAKLTETAAELSAHWAQG